MPVNEFDNAVNNNNNLIIARDAFIAQQADIMNDFIIPPTPHNNPQVFQNLRQEISNFLNSYELPNDNEIVNHLEAAVVAQIHPPIHNVIAPIGDEDEDEDARPNPR